MVFIPPGELRADRWKDIDLDAALWSHTSRKTRRQTRVGLIIPLCLQDLDILCQLRAVNGRGVYVFHDPRKDGYLSKNTVLGALRPMGYEKEVMSGDGFRALARTLLAGRLKCPRELIDMQLAHRVAGILGRAYNRKTFIED